MESADDVPQAASVVQPVKKEEIEKLVSGVNYVYSNRFALGIGSVDVRIAFGDSFGNETRPVTGIILTHQQALGLAEMLTRNLEKLKMQIKKLPTPPQSTSSSGD